MVDSKNKLARRGLLKAGEDVAGGAAIGSWGISNHAFSQSPSSL